MRLSDSLGNRSRPRRVARILRSFGYAGQGLSYLYATQPNVWVHTCAAALVVTLAALLGITFVEVAILVLTIGLVLICEAFNSALEALVDLASPRYHPLAKTTKDVSAAAVLIAAVVAAMVGAAIFLPRLADRLSSA